MGVGGWDGVGVGVELGFVSRELPRSSASSCAARVRAARADARRRGAVGVALWPKAPPCGLRSVCE